MTEVTQITEGQFKGWYRTPNGDIFKAFGPLNVGPIVWYTKGFFEVCDKNGVKKKHSYGTLVEALNAVGINKT